MSEEFRMFGPPGTGKTTRLTQYVKRGAELYGSDGVVVASFTRAAAVELQGRDLPLNPTHVGTLHALCYRALDKPTIAETMITEFNESQTLFQLSGGRIDIDEPEQVYDTESDRLFAEYQVLRARLVRANDWPPLAKKFGYAWDSWKAETGYIDFTDMVELAISMRVPPPDGAQIGFFDEVQDFTALELKLIRQWGESLDRIVLAGDDDQCIYGFKGASPRAFLEPPIPDGDPHKEVLAQSYRMPSAIHEVTQDWIGGVRGPREPKPFSPRDYTGSVEQRPGLRYKDAISLVNEAIDRSNDGHSVMLLAACSYQVAPIVQELRNRGALFHNPYRRKRGDWNPLSPGRGRSSGQRLASLLAFDRSVWGDEARDWTYADLIDWLPLVKKSGVFRRGATTSLDSQFPEMTISGPALAALFEDGAVDEIRRSPLEWVGRHMAAPKARGLSYPLHVARQQGAAALVSGTPNIVVGTIHSVKGGEADDVYLMPDVSPAGHVQWLNTGTRDDVLRQFYVGMSRAKERLVLCGQSQTSAVTW